jgi:pyruvate/2-oxoglutarate dehydrogenase complex dihydrolipoamide dehydrogenase (E3) component
MTDTYDFLAIGSGPAGESAAELASFFGHRSGVVEMAYPGGTVTTTGGAPTKTLREAALYFSGLREGDVYGLRMNAAPEIATETIRQRTKDVCQLLQAVTAENIAANKVDLIQGTARLQPDGRVLVSGADGRERVLVAKVILIATGSRPRHPPQIPFDIPGVCDTDTILHRGRVPKDILIVGGGPVGVEFATICHALGARVTLLDRGSRLMPVMDGEIAARMEQLFRDWGITIRFSSTAEGVVAKGDILEVTLSNGDVLHPDTVLFAAGRQPNTDDLGLDKAGIATDARGYIEVDENMQVPGRDWLYAIGDVNGRSLLTHIGKYQGRIAADVILGRPARATQDGPGAPRVIFTDPEVAAVGHTEATAKQAGLDVRVVDYPTAQVAGASYRGRNAPGTSRIVVDERRSVIVGATFTGPEIAEALHAATIAVVGEVPLERLAHAVPAFPSRSEVWLYLMQKLGLSGPCQRET